jgi:hypothetical protein
MSTAHAEAVKSGTKSILPNLHSCSLPGAVPIGRCANNHLHLHFLYYCDASGHHLDWLMVPLAVFRWGSGTVTGATGHGRRRLLCSCGRICQRSCHHHAVAISTATTGTHQLSLLPTLSTCKVSAWKEKLSFQYAGGSNEPTWKEGNLTQVFLVRIYRGTRTRTKFTSSMSMTEEAKRERNLRMHPPATRLLWHRPKRWRYSVHQATMPRR